MWPRLVGRWGSCQHVLAVLSSANGQTCRCLSSPVTSEPSLTYREPTTNLTQVLERGTREATPTSQNLARAIHQLEYIPHNSYYSAPHIYRRAR
ncbi:hypothetical protein V8C26DRAFT_173807 [Trichoderma gracile]